VDGARQQVLAGAGLALEQDRGVGAGDSLEHTEDLAHRQAAPADRSEVLGGAGQQLDPRVPRHEPDLDLAEREDVAGLQEAVGDPHPADEHAVGRLLVDHAVGVVLAADLRVHAGHRLVGQNDVTLARLAQVTTSWVTSISRPRSSPLRTTSR
jgi:hypothetical protein